jgi:hypothetical protein
VAWTFNEYPVFTKLNKKTTTKNTLIFIFSGMSFSFSLSLKGGVDFEKALTVAFVQEGSHSALSGLQVHLAFSRNFRGFSEYTFA